MMHAWLALVIGASDTNSPKAASQPASQPVSQPRSQAPNADPELLQNLEFLEFLELMEDAEWLAP
jgi:hypothetical protein